MHTEMPRADLLRQISNPSDRVSTNDRSTTNDYLSLYSNQPRGRASRCNLEVLAHQLREFSAHAELGRASMAGSVLQKPLVQFTHITARPGYSWRRDERVVSDATSTDECQEVPGCSHQVLGQMMPANGQ
jgi:hypothetical protein